MARKFNPGKRHYLVCYTLLGVVLLLAYGVFAIWPNTILMLTARMGDSLESFFWVKVLYGLSTVVTGLTMLTVVMSAESYLRNGLRQRKLLSRFARLAIPLASICVAGVIAQFVAIGLG